MALARHYLDNEAISALQIKTNTDTVKLHDLMYDQFKSAYKLAYTNHFRGDGADLVKTYLLDGEVNIIKGFLEISTEVSIIMQHIAETFIYYETNMTGKVDTDVLQYIRNSISQKEKNFNDLHPDIISTYNKAKKYISGKDPNILLITDAYTSLKSKVDTIENGLNDNDQGLITTIEELYNRINELKTLISNVINAYYDSEGNIKSDFSSKISSNTWHVEYGNRTLSVLMEEDPFKYSSKDVSLSEDQWAAGLCSDVYAYAGYKRIYLEKEVTIEDGKYSGSAAFGALALYGTAQFTDYLSGKVEARGGYFDGSLEASWKEGIDAKGEIGVGKAESSVILGTDDLNIGGKASAEVLTADGRAVFEFKDEDNFAFGIGGNATAAKASASAGINGLKGEYSYVKDGKKIEEELFDFNVGTSAGLSIGAGAFVESKTAIEMKYANVNVVSLDVDLEVLIGLKIDVSLPYVKLKWPW